MLLDFIAHPALVMLNSRRILHDLVANNTTCSAGESLHSAHLFFFFFFFRYVMPSLNCVFYVTKS